MQKRDIRKQRNFEIKNDLKDYDETLITNVLIKKINNVKYEADVHYDGNDDIIEVNGTIDYSIQAIDARDGKEVTHSEVLDWNDEYSLDEQTEIDTNIIKGNDVDFNALAVEQINANIPINFTHNNGIISKTGSGWALMSEEEFDKAKNEQPDPRWEKLKEFSSTDQNKTKK